MLVHTRPAEADGVRLFYRQVPKYNKKKYNPRDPENMIIQVRLMRWAASEEFTNVAEKNWLTGKILPDVPMPSKTRIGRILSSALPYRCNFQRNPGPGTGGRNLQFWRWQHPLEIQYGMEYMILEWLPDFVALVSNGAESVETGEQFEEELQILMDQTYDEDLTLIRLAAIDADFALRF